MNTYPMSFHWYNTLSRWLELTRTAETEENLDMYCRNAVNARAEYMMAWAVESVQRRQPQ